MVLFQIDVIWAILWFRKLGFGELGFSDLGIGITGFGEMRLKWIA